MSVLQSTEYMVFMMSVSIVEWLEMSNLGPLVSIKGTCQTLCSFIFCWLNCLEEVVGMR